MATGDVAGYRLTPKAEADLERIWRFSAATWSADQADRYVDALIRTIETIAAMPDIARDRPEFDPPVRIHPVAEHLIIYRVDGCRLLVIRILGGRQNWRAILDVIDA